MTADMSHSLNVVSIAASCWAATRRWAIFWRRGDNLRRVCRADATGLGAAGPAPAAPAAGAEGALATARPASAAASMSPLETRPPLPEPAMVAGSMPVSTASRRTAGDCSCDASRGEGTPPTAAAAGATPAADSSIDATTWPIFTSAPASILMEICPAASAAPSAVILSVSSSNSAWSFLTRSPSLTYHLASTPVVMDSPIEGILTSIAMGKNCPLITRIEGNQKNSS